MDKPTVSRRTSAYMVFVNGYPWNGGERMKRRQALRLRKLLRSLSPDSVVDVYAEHIVK
jgi:hypothetical protein